MALIKIPVSVPKDVQAAIAVLGVVGAAGTEILQDLTGFLPPAWATAISSGLVVVAGIAGFLKEAAPLLDELAS